jgi:predicted RNA-binding Zn-ribbon protein involved in translation (DUF1610 family)
MKTEKLYCHNCNKETIHRIKEENILGCSGFGRIIMGIFSAGMSELDQTVITTCMECGNEEIYD